MLRNFLTWARNKDNESKVGKKEIECKRQSTKKRQTEYKKETESMEEKEKKDGKKEMIF